ncbi:questin oxidase family protein [Streptomyces sp. CAI-121]|uniref:questin oxidase family protein n=1 Tax=unclassified Streptomyces TaxID=2593676 RepID=UPI00158783A0|nr:MULTISPECIES: questin oxidase family protein [unclassified Streptomyces]NUV71809.1 questin oxidase family protein [Streptomyces sp. CAI-121]NUW17980.1 questin oxidase family protein [Streptomyces sp. CAI-68]
MDDTTGTLDEALERIHLSGPERDGWLSNHAPMAVEALVRHGQASAVHRWLDRYGPKLEEMPDGTGSPVTARSWQEALGDPRRIADWTAHFDRETAGHPWRDVLVEWWPRLLPGIAAGATHAVIRVGHSVRTLLAGGETAPRVRELAHALAYWAARHQPLPGLAPLGPAPSAAEALDRVPLVPEQSGGIQDRFAQLTAFPDWPAREAASAEAARSALRELVRASTHRYATHAHGDPIMLVHAATAPNAVLRTLPALPGELWAPSLRASWAASAAVTAAYAPREAAPAPTSATGAADAGELFARAAAHGDDHTIKFADTALDVGDALAFSAARRAIELNPPVF